ncbi:MAG: hypothetical protein R3C16_13485 [Hyphomonadaceae bacterium]
MAETVLINAGDVIDVQLTSETVVIESARGRRQVERAPGHIQDRMRLFVRETDGREQKYDFDDTELGVRETQRVAVVRQARAPWREPVNLILFNLSSGEKDCFEPGLAAHLGLKPFFSAIAKAIALARHRRDLLAGELLPLRARAVTSGIYGGIWAFLLSARPLVALRRTRTVRRRTHPLQACAQALHRRDGKPSAPVCVRRSAAGRAAIGDAPSADVSA